MNPILEEVRPETAERIAALAKEKGLSVDEYLRSLLPNGSAQPEENVLTPEERANLWLEWVASHSVKGVIADDSRESIYTREDEAL